MKRKRYTEEQIIGVVKMVETGSGIAEICREAGFLRRQFTGGKRSMAALRFRK